MLKTISLNGAWTFQDTKASYVKKPLETDLPSTIHSDLFRHGLIPDPFYRDNETKLNWVVRQDWVYRKSFRVDASFLQLKKKLIRFESIDTFSRITLNGVVLGETNNFYRPYVFEVGHLLKEENLLEVTLFSPIKVLGKLSRKHGYLFFPFSKTPLSPYARKPQYSFGWDWGPSFPTSGIWQDVELVGYDSAKISHVFAKQRSLSPSAAVLDIQVELDVTTFAKDDMVVTVGISDGRQTVSSQVMRKMHDGLNLISQTVHLADPLLWWPKGYGEQHLYTVTAQVSYRDEVIGTHSRKFGLRTIEIEQKKDTEGRNFVFRINGTPVFCKGMNWIPADSFLDRATDDKYHRSLRQMADANMNMVRIWGGGIYEKDLFYDLCDELGILVWQDFMSACQEMPDHLDWFRAQFSEEAVYQIKRLRNHPALVLWCGNNENEGIRYQGWSNAPKRDVFHGEHLYHSVLPDLCEHYDSTRPYLPTSPYGDERRYNSIETGDFHSYEGWGSGNWEDYLNVKGRFISETGYQSFPDMETLESFTKPADRKIFGKIILAHEKTLPSSEWAIKQIVTGLDKCLGYENVSDFKQFAYLSQVNWAEGAKRCIETWRSRKFDTSGILFWQFNDCWPVISWAFVDYFMRPKLCYYSLKEAFKPIITTCRMKDGIVEWLVVNDTVEEKKLTLRLRLFSMTEEKMLIKTVAVSAAPNSVTQALEIPVAALGLKDSRREFVVTDAQVQGEVVHRNYFFQEPFGRLDLPAPKLSCSVKRISAHCAEVRIVSDSLAPALKISAPESYDYSDNYLVLLPGKAQTLEVISTRPLADDLELCFKALNVEKEQTFPI
jgi:beta-mannosidase